MPVIELEIFIQAEPHVVFDLARSIDLHQLSAAKTKEEAIGRKTTGLLELNEEVTWRARHFGIYQKLTSKITEMNYPDHFTDEMVRGIFKRFRHDHYFESTENGTLMKDIFDYTAPLGFLGKLADRLFLERYMKRFLVDRNAVIKEYAEMDE